MNTVEAIKNYILFLKEHHDLSITLHPMKPENVISSSELISFNIHDNSYCVYLKTCPAARCHCIERQPKILKRLGEPFVGVCYAGVREFVYPIFDGKENIGFISVSGYQTEHPESYIERASGEYCLDGEALKGVYSSLKKMPSMEDVNTLMLPLCGMLELAYREREGPSVADDGLAERVVKYVKLRKNEAITSKEICKHFYCSRAYMSTQFNRYTGMSIREYINKLRIEDAKMLLKNSNLSVTEIALSVGYHDSNYFSNVFKRMMGMSPLKYRKST